MHRGDLQGAAEKDLRFLAIFHPQRLKNFKENSTCTCLLFVHIYAKLRNQILFNYLQIRQSYAIL